MSSPGLTATAKLADFGLCKQIDLTVDEHIVHRCGTPEYMAPEVMGQQPYRSAGGLADFSRCAEQCLLMLCNSSSADMWSLGVLMYFILSGDLPFRINYFEAVPVPP